MLLLASGGVKKMKIPRVKGFQELYQNPEVSGHMLLDLQRNTKAKQFGRQSSLAGKQSPIMFKNVHSSAAFKWIKSTVIT